MGRIKVRQQVLALLAFACLAAVQLAAAAHPVAIGRELLAARPFATAVNVTRNQFVQVTWALEGETCASVTNKVRTKLGETDAVYFNNTIAKTVVKDFQSILTELGWPEAARTVVAVRQPCVTFQINGESYASYRAMVRFNSTNTTEMADMMFAGIGSGAGRPCAGSYSRILYANMAALFAVGPFKVSQNNGNRQNAFNPNGPGVTGWGDNWVEYAGPNMTICTRNASPSPGVSPSPSPEVSPSPSPDVSPSPSPDMSPSPSPSPPPIPCPDNSTYDFNSTACVCNPGFTPAFNSSSTLISCINGTNIAECPASTPIEVKTLANSPTIVSCITTDAPCPAGFTLILFNSVPSVRQECRPNQGGCNYIGFSLQVTSANNSLIGCVNATTNACPFVAFRSAPTWPLDRCQDVTACPAHSANNTIHTVPALPVNATSATVPLACLTLGTPQACPNVTNLAFPILVTLNEPNSPPCGNNATVCTLTRTVQCMAVNSTCTSPYTLRLFRNPAGPASTPVLAECRHTRSTCDLTATGMNTVQNPNAGTYNIEVRTGDALDGCVAAGSTACPAGYPFPSVGAGGALSACRTSQTTSCSSMELPLYDITGNITGCQLATLPCPNAFPITLRRDISGNRAGCLAFGSKCPAAYNTPMYGFFTALSGVAANNLTITNCWLNGIVSSCSAVIIDSSALPAGSGGTYSKPIVTSTGGTGGLIGCMISTATVCPADYPFSYIDFASSGTAMTVPTAPTLDKCAPAGELTACPAFIAPTSGLPTMYYKPGYTRSTLTACIKYYTAPFNSPAGTLPVCPSTYPIVSIQRPDPAAVTGQDQVLGCYSSDSSCLAHSPGTPFSLVPGSGTGYCVPQIIGLQTCGGYPVTTYQSGLPLFSPDGRTLIGCAVTTSSCPALFPIYFQNAASPPVIQRCQASIADGSTCTSVSNGAFPVQIQGLNNTVVGCQAASSTCAANQVTLSLTVDGPAVGCAASTTACADANYPFGLYDGTMASGGKLVRCLPAQNAANCDGAIFGTYNVEVYGVSDPPGNVIGCMKSNINTPCPIGAPIPYMTQVAPTSTGALPTFAVTQCRANPAVPNLFIGGATYNIPMRSSDGTQTLGYIASPATTCPTDLISPCNVAFFLIGTSATSPIEECRQVIGSTPGFAAGCAAFLGPTPFTIPIASTANSANLAGCARMNFAGCPVGYSGQYTGAAVSGCQSIATCNVAPFTNTIYDATGTQIGCGEGTACAALFPTSRVDLKTADGAAPAGCMSGSATQCPTGYAYSIYSASSGRRPLLSQCWVSAAAGLTCGTGASPAAATVPVYDVFAQTTRVGCTLPDINCPDAASYFRSDVADVGSPAFWTGKLTGAQPTTNYCFRTAPSQCTGSTVPVRANSIAGDSSAVILGCLNAPTANTADLGSGKACPSVLPVNGDFTFFVATAVAVTGPPAVTAGNVVECRRNAPDKSCGNLVPVRAYDSTAFPGCISLIGSGTCPTTGYTNSLNYVFELWGPTTATDASPRIEACITAPGAAAASYACSNVVPAATYPIPISSDMLDANLPSDTGANLQGCARAGNTACPTGFFPLIGSNLQVHACRGARQNAVAGGCNATYVPLCDMQGGAGGATGAPQIAADGLCPGANTFACVAAAGSTFSTCSSLTSASKYPTSITGVVASQYKFIVKIQAQGTYTLVSCGVASTQATACNAASTFTNRAYPVGVVQNQNNGAFSGCTDGTDAICDAWWAGPSPGGSCS